MKITVKNSGGDANMVIHGKPQFVVVLTEANVYTVQRKTCKLHIPKLLKNGILLKMENLCLKIFLLAVVKKFGGNANLAMSGRNLFIIERKSTLVVHIVPTKGYCLALMTSKPHILR